MTALVPTLDVPPVTIGPSAGHYRPEIDGLRAVAVLMVVFYHAGLGFPGGFIGVDVFFVISGFLITSLIWKDLQQDRFTLVGFWARRARRIAPAALVMSLAALAAGWFLFWPEDLVRLSLSARAHALFVANFAFNRVGGYFDQPAEQVPLLHTWSLAVEEQFYMIVPLALMALYRYPRWRRSGVVTVLLTVALMASLALNVEGVARGRASAFYLLPGRGWELLVGSILALGAGVWPAARQSWREAASAVGLLMVLVPAFAYDKTTPFPGLAALPPCLGTALVIWANTPSRTFIGGALATRPMVFVGLISYSLYLWHWPLLAFSRYALPDGLTPGYRVGLVVSAFALAVLSWRWVETPFRRRQLLSSRWSILAFTAAAVAGISTLTGFIELARGVPSRLGAGEAIYEAARYDHGLRADVKLRHLRDDTLVKLGSAAPDAPVTVVLWGDSHAMTMAVAVDNLCTEYGVAGRLIARTGSPPVLGYIKPGANKQLPDTLDYNQEVVNYVRAHHVRHVILTAYWNSCGHAGDQGTTDLDTGLIATVKSLVDAGATPWIVLQTPVQPFNVPQALARAAVSGEDITDRLARVSATDGLTSATDTRLTDRLTAAGARLLDPRPRFVDPAAGHYIIAVNDTALYYDAHHLTASGARLMILPLLRESIGVALRADGDSKPK